MTTNTYKTAGCITDDIEQALLTAKAALQTGDESLKTAALSDIETALKTEKCYSIPIID